jgi:phosphoserine phosphatase
MRWVDAFVVDFDKTLTQAEKLNRVAAGLRYADSVRAALNVRGRSGRSGSSS